MKKQCETTREFLRAFHDTGRRVKEFCRSIDQRAGAATAEGRRRCRVEPSAFRRGEIARDDHDSIRGEN